VGKRSRSAAAAAGVAFAVALAPAGQSAFGATPVYQPPQKYYLALGDSMAYGFQPTKRPGAAPETFSTGYVNVFAKRLRRLAPGIATVNYSCPGESSVTFKRGGCAGLEDGFKLHDAFRGPQLKAALDFLRGHPGEVSPITVTLWGNDLAPLSAKGKRAARAIRAFGSRLRSILEDLRAAAPDSEIIVTGAWNPEADRFTRAEPLYRSLGRTITAAADASLARVADMFSALNGSGRRAPAGRGSAG